MDYYGKVREFTKATSPSVVPSTLQEMTEEEVLLFTNLIIEELLEFLIASFGNSAPAVAAIQRAMSNLRGICAPPPQNKYERIALQQDALADLVYVGLNGAAKTGSDFDRVFNLVHDSNMKKVDPATGKVLRREDGKVIKPDGWTPPDILSEIKRQLGE